MNYVPGDLRDQLAHVGYDVVQAGLVCGSGGNLSARMPDQDACWVTAGGTWLDRLSRTSFAAVRVSDGATVEPSRVPPTSEIALHLALYRARPDVHAVVHLHPQTTLLLDAHMFGLSMSDIADELRTFRPDIVVVTTAPTYLFWRCAPPELRVPQQLTLGLREFAPTLVAVGTADGGSSTQLTNLHLPTFVCVRRGATVARLRRMVLYRSKFVKVAAHGSTRLPMTMSQRICCSPVRRYGLLTLLVVQTELQSHRWLRSSNEDPRERGGVVGTEDGAAPRRFDLPASARSVMRTLYANGPSTRPKLVRELQLSKPTMSKPMRVSSC